MARSTARVDAGQVIKYAEKLALTVSLVDQMRDNWEEEWGGNLADELRRRAPQSESARSPGSLRYGHLRDNIEQVDRRGGRAGGVTFGDAFWWKFLEYGTVKMSPRPFIRPAIKSIRSPARKDAVVRALRLLEK